MKTNSSYEIGSIRFTVTEVRKGLFKCIVVNRYECFYIPIEDGNAKLASGEIKEITS